jgi:antitoxin (DNA-binding transcriptional repressor) of toxin-antitoxin stability system
MSAAHDFELLPHTAVPAEAVDAAEHGYVVYLTRNGEPVAAVVPPMSPQQAPPRSKPSKTQPTCEPYARPATSQARTSRWPTCSPSRAMTSPPTPANGDPPLHHRVPPISGQRTREAGRANAGTNPVSDRRARRRPTPRRGVKALTGESGTWRIRIGDYRVVYEINDAALIVLVIRVAHRNDVYRRR